MVSKFKKINVAHDFNLKLKMYSLPVHELSINLKKKINLISLSNIKRIDLIKDKISVFWGNRLSLDILKKMKNLKWIHLGSSSCDPSVEVEAKKKGVIITRSNKINSKPVATLAIAFILYFSKGLNLINKKKYNRKLFDKKFDDLSDLSNTKILIVGKGYIAKQLKKILLNISNEVIQVNSKIYKKNFYKIKKYNNLIKTSKYIINCLPFNVDTYKIFNDKIFKHFNNTIFINVGRGETVDEDSLLKNIKSGKIKYAALDVFDRKRNYLTPYTPLKYNSKLWNNKKIIITPHIASFDNKYWSKEIKHFESLFKNFEKKLF